MPLAFGQVQPIGSSARVNLSSVFAPAVLRGIRVDPQNPFYFEFILDHGQSNLEGEALKAEGTKLVKYFLASLTLPENDLWVNLSPYEKDRIIPDAFGQTEMGRQLLFEDYLLKQLSASLLHPDEETGKNFWNKVRKIAAQKLGVTDVSQQALSRIWIMPQKAVVYQDKATAFIGETHLKVLMQEDYEVLAKNIPSQGGEANVAISNGLPRPTGTRNKISSISSSVFRDEVLPIIEKEVNEGKNFASLRQVYHSLILASWYKRILKESILSQVYVDQKKVAGIESDDQDAKQRIYEEYLETFKKGVYNLIREEEDEKTGELIPRKYFSGGVTLLSSQALEMRPLTVSSAITPKGKLTLLSTEAQGYKSRMKQNTKVRVIPSRTVNVAFANLEGKPNFNSSSREKKLLTTIVKQLVAQELDLGIVSTSNTVTVGNLAETESSKIFLVQWGDFKYVLKWSKGANFDQFIETQWQVLRAINRDGSDRSIVQPVMRGQETVDGNPSPEYIIMDYIKGEDLSTKITRDGVFSEKDAIEFILKLAKVVQRVHASKSKTIVRDLAPNNIRVREDKSAIGEPVLYDFGSSMTKNDLRLPYYAESTLKDIDGVGMVLYFVLTGDYRMTSEYLQESDLARIQNVTLRNIVAKAINFNGEQYQNVSELIVDLQKVQSDLGYDSAVSSSAVDILPFLQANDVLPSKVDDLVILGFDNLDVFRDVLKLFQDAVGKRIVILGGFGRITVSLVQKAVQSGYEIKISDGRTVNKENLAAFNAEIATVDHPQSIIKFSEANIIKQIMQQMVASEPAFVSLKNKIKDSDFVLEERSPFTTANLENYRAILEGKGVLEGDQPLRILYTQAPHQQLRSKANFDHVFSAQLRSGQVEGYSHVIGYDAVGKTNYDLAYDFGGEAWRFIVQTGLGYFDMKSSQLPNGVDSLPDKFWTNIQSLFDNLPESQKNALARQWIGLWTDITPNSLTNRIDALQSQPAQNFARAIVAASSAVEGASFPDITDTQVGGIDFREENLNLDLRGQAETFSMPTDASQYQNIQIEGLVPVILNIAPLPSLPAFINITAASSLQPAQISLKN